jgi:hypothetical protein
LRDQLGVEAGGALSATIAGGRQLRQRGGGLNARARTRRRDVDERVLAEGRRCRRASTISRRFCTWAGA